MEGTWSGRRTLRVVVRERIDASVCQRSARAHDVKKTRARSRASFPFSAVGVRALGRGGGRRTVSGAHVGRSNVYRLPVHPLVGELGLCQLAGGARLPCAVHNSIAHGPTLTSLMKPLLSVLVTWVVHVQPLRPPRLYIRSICWYSTYDLVRHRFTATCARLTACLAPRAWGV